MKVWGIPDEGFTKTETESLITLNGHGRKVTLLRFHPTANNLLARCGNRGGGVGFIGAIYFGEISGKSDMSEVFSRSIDPSFLFLHIIRVRISVQHI